MMRNISNFICVAVLVSAMATIAPRQAWAQRAVLLPPISCNIQPAGTSVTAGCRNPTPPAPPAPPALDTWKNNGIISMNIDEDGFPMISNLSVLGSGVMYFDNAGAGLQIDSRSDVTGIYNPTQAGDCAQNPSRLLALNTDWGGNGIGIPASYGIQWRVQPRNYNGPHGTCAGTGALLPYEFDFAATLGDGAHLPKQGMLVDFSMTRLVGSQPIDRSNSELGFFPLTYYFPLAYWSPDGVTFYKLMEPGSQGPTNNSGDWPLGADHGVNDAKSIMLCGTLENDICLAIYSNQATLMALEHVQGAKWYETAMSVRLVGNGFITDLNQHTGVRIIAVGNQATIKAVIAAAKAHIHNWGDL